MPKGTELIVHEGELSFYKGMPDWRRGLTVELRAPGGRPRRLAFPADRTVLRVADLEPAVEYDILVRRAGVRGLVAAPRRLRARPSARRLRAAIAGSGRCGTASMAEWLDGMPLAGGGVLRARHETLSDHLLPLLAAGDRERLRHILSGLPHDVEAAPLLTLAPDAFAAETVIHLVRDGRRVVQSGLNRGWYQGDTPWNRIKPDFPGDPFERCCRFWEHAVRQGEAMATVTFRLEDLVRSPQERERLLRAVGCEPDGRPLPVANRGHGESSWRDWDAARRGRFDALCGDAMDRLYGGWRSQW